MSKFLDDTGLAYFWGKITAIFAKKTDIPTAVSELTNDSGYVTTDANVTQTAIDNTSTDEYRVLLSNTANDTTETAGVNKNTNLKFKPNGGQLTVPILKIIGSASANGEMSAANIKASATIGGRVFVGTYGENSTNILLTIDPDDGTITLGNDLINVIKGIKVKNATSADSATKVGSSTVGGADQLVYLDNGTPKAGTSASTSATANTIAKRQGNGYLYATFYHTSMGSANISSYTSEVAFVSSDGFLRKTTLANFKTWFGKANSAATASACSGNAATATKATYAALNYLGYASGKTAKTFTVNENATEVLICCHFSSKLLSASIPKNLLSTSVREIWCGGGKNNSTSAVGGAARALCNVTLNGKTLTVTGVAANNEGTDVLNSTTWYVYCR